jgi:hypothetical protein
LWFIISSERGMRSERILISCRQNFTSPSSGPTYSMCPISKNTHGQDSTKLQTFFRCCSHIQKPEARLGWGEGEGIRSQPFIHQGIQINQYQLVRFHKVRKTPLRSWMRLPTKYETPDLLKGMQSSA